MSPENLPDLQIGRYFPNTLCAATQLHIIQTKIFKQNPKYLQYLFLPLTQFHFYFPGFQFLHPFWKCREGVFVALFSEIPQFCRQLRVKEGGESLIKRPFQYSLITICSLNPSLTPTACSHLQDLLDFGRDNRFTLQSSFSLLNHPNIGLDKMASVAERESSQSMDYGKGITKTLPFQQTLNTFYNRI